MLKIEETKSFGDFKHESIKECFEMMNKLSQAFTLESSSIEFLKPYLLNLEETQHLIITQNIQKSKINFINFQDSFHCAIAPAPINLESSIILTS